MVNYYFSNFNRIEGAFFWTLKFISNPGVLKILAWKTNILKSSLESTKVKLRNLFYLVIGYLFLNIILLCLILLQIFYEGIHKGTLFSMCNYESVLVLSSKLNGQMSWKYWWVNWSKEGKLWFNCGMFYVAEASV